MTHCDYCKRQYADPPKSCEGCGAPLAAAGSTWGNNQAWFDPFAISADDLLRAYGDAYYPPRECGEETDDYMARVMRNRITLANNHAGAMQPRFGLANNSVFGRW